MPLRYAGARLCRGCRCFCSRVKVWAYVAALTALAKGGQWKASEALMEEMRANGVEPNL